MQGDGDIVPGRISVMKRTIVVIGCVLCLCLCAVAVTPAMAKNVISPQTDKLADHKLDTGYPARERSKMLTNS